MASVAAVGPPPGLGPPKVQAATSNAHEDHALGNQKYSRSRLLRLSQSPLVTVPEGIPPFADWFGEWETYTPRPHNHQHNHERHGNHRSEYTPRVGNRYTHVPEDGSGPMGEFSFHKSAVDSSASAAPGSGTGYLTGFQGVRRREGERGERAEGSRGFRKYEDRHERAGEERSTRGGFDRDQGDGFGRGGNPRFPASGKNPFGQLSASGTFKPAGRGEGSEVPTDKRGFPLGSRMASYGRNDREASQLDENGRPVRQLRGTPKDGSALRDQRRRQEGADDGLEGGDWETVPRSPETERRLARAGGLADSASDWRKGSGASGTPKRSGESAVGRGGLRGGRSDVEGRRGAGNSSAFPSWMADANETPSWMDDSPTASSSGGPGERRERGKLNFDAFKGSEVHATPMEGEDSIQAFKREMKRREAEARAKESPQEDGSNIAGQNRAGPPPGLSRPQVTESGDDQASSPLKPPGLSDDAHERSNTSSSDATHVDAGDRSTDSIEARPNLNSQSSGAAAAGPGGRGSSRFARFFDGAAATNRAKEAQERAMAAHAAASSSGAAPIQSQDQSGKTGANVDVASPGPAAGNGEGMAALFAGMGLNASRRDASQEQSGRGGVPPSEADVQGMQKIMAMLRGGGSDQGSEGGAKGVSSPNASTQTASPAAGNNNASANLMAMLAGASMGQGGRTEAPSSPQSQHHASSHRHSTQQVPPGLDISRLAGGGQGSPTPARSQSPSVGFNAGGVAGLQNRSQSPGVPFRNERPQQAHFPAQSPGGPGPGPYSQGPPPGFGPPGGRPGSGFGLDPRMMGRPSPGQQGGINGVDSSPAGTPGNGAISGGGRGSNGDNVNIGNLPPHIQQQLMGLPPHVQHAVLNGRGLPPGGPPPFHPSMQGIPPPPGMGGPPHHLGPFGPPPPGHHFGGLPPFLAGHQGPYGGGGGGGANGGTSPGGLPPHLGPYGASPNPAPSAGLSPNPSAASPSGATGFPPGMMHGHGHHGHGPPPGIYGQGR